MADERGKIFAEEAYALGKMLDNSFWQKGSKRLPRNITPSDIDMPGVPLIFDNNGMMIFCELCRSKREWGEVTFGQRLLYENLIKGTPHCAVLCGHEIDPSVGRQIDTRHDITAFQIMVQDFGGIAKWPLIKTNSAWQEFVFTWMETADWAG